jgi:hypothetical protein
VAMTTQILFLNGGSVPLNFSPSDATGLSAYGYDATSLLKALPNFVFSATDRAVVKYVLKAALIGGGMGSGPADTRADLILNEPNGAYRAAQMLMEYHLGTRLGFASTGA